MSKEYSKLLDGLLDGESLEERQAYGLMHKLAEGELPEALAGALLAGLRAKGETADEIRGFATAMRELAVHPAIPDGKPTVDTVGTGGDGSGSFNISTGAGLLAAACGVRVVKHGNRSISSRSGSADMLERLGMPLPLHEKEAVDCLQATNFTFLFFKTDVVTLLKQFECWQMIILDSAWHRLRHLFEQSTRRGSDFSFLRGLRIFGEGTS